MNVIAHVKNRLVSPSGIARVFCAMASLTVGLAWGAQNGLVDVSVAKGKNDSQIVKIQFKQDVGGEPVAFTTTNPNRLVLDFADTSNSLGRGSEELNNGAIKSYQAVQSGERTRLVINLARPTNYELRKDKNVVYAILQTAGGDAESASAPHPKSVTAGAGQSVRDIEFQRGKNGEGRVTVTLSTPGVAADIQQKGKTVQVDFMNTVLPASLQRRLDVADFATPAQLVESFAREGGTRLVVTPRGKWDYYAYQVADKFILEVRSLEDPQLAKTDRPVYSGEKLTLNFQNVDVRAVLQVIADFTGLNIIASDTVSGNITLRLKDVPWDQALDIIMRSRGLDKRVSGNVIWIAPRDELTAKEKAELEAKKSLLELEPLVTRSYKLNYVRADDAMVVLAGGSRKGAGGTDDATCSPSSTGIQADVAAGGASGSSVSATSSQGGGSSTTTSNVNRVLSTRGGASHDLTTNTLVVTDTMDKHQAVEEVLRQIDIPMRQVMIEARIVIADDKFGRDLGARLDVRAYGGIHGTRFGIAGDSNKAIDMINDRSVAPENKASVDLPIAGGQTLGLTVVNAASTILLGLELQALEADKRGKIVSNPRVVTTNLKPAVILQGTQIPYQTYSTGSVAPTTSFKDALLCLLVSPQVLNNDSVILNVEVQKDARGETTNAGPAINVRRVKTQVRVNNGETAILGGIFEQNLRDDSSKVPVLGDIPVLGNLFKTTSKLDDKSELLIFLTPRLLDETLSVVR